MKPSALLVKLLVCFFVRRNLTDTPPTRDLERLFISICESLESEGLKGIAAAEYIKSASSTCLPVTLPSKNVLKGRLRCQSPI